MTVPGQTARSGLGSGLGGVVAVWVFAAVLAVVIGVVAPEDERGAWMPVGLAGCMILAFGIQLYSGRAEGFLRRVSASSLGALVVMGLVGLVVGLAVVLSA